jgi:hypothetical protein
MGNWRGVSFQRSPHPRPSKYQPTPATPVQTVSIRFSHLSISQRSPQDPSGSLGTQLVFVPAPSVAFKPAGTLVSLTMAAAPARFPLRYKPSALSRRISTRVISGDPSIPTGDFQTLQAVVDRSVSPRRFTLLLLGAFAGTALILAALGIYGVLSYSVSQRVPEIGIRMALGESSGQVLGRVVGRTLALAGVGVVVGAVGAFLASRLLASLLYGVEPTDPATFVGSSAEYARPTTA